MSFYISISFIKLHKNVITGTDNIKHIIIFVKCNRISAPHISANQKSKRIFLIVLLICISFIINEVKYSLFN